MELIEVNEDQKESLQAIKDDMEDADIAMKCGARQYKEHSRRMFSFIESEYPEVKDHHVQYDHKRGLIKKLFKEINTEAGKR